MKRSALASVFGVWGRVKVWRSAGCSVVGRHPLDADAVAAEREQGAEQAGGGGCLARAGQASGRTLT